MRSVTSHSNHIVGRPIVRLPALDCEMRSMKRMHHALGKRRQRRTSWRELPHGEWLVTWVLKNNGADGEGMERGVWGAEADEQEFGTKQHMR